MCRILRISQSISDSKAAQDKKLPRKTVRRLNQADKPSVLGRTLIAKNGQEAKKTGSCSKTSRHNKEKHAIGKKGRTCNKEKTLHLH